MGMIRATFLCATILVFLDVPAGAVGVPSQWAQLGSVEDWRDVDHRKGHWSLGRQWEINIIHDGDQQAIYRRTYEVETRWPRIAPADWDALTPEEQQGRRVEANHLLGYVGAFHTRMQSKGTRWGAGKSTDITVVGECLGRLHAAVGVDPTNGYAWNLLGYLAAAVGDTRRAAAAYAETERAFDRLGEGALVADRRRLALERAWLWRDLGDFGRAAHQVDLAEQNGGEDEETLVLRGLIAAQTGREREALQLADRVGHIDVDRRHAYGQRDAPSDFARAWISALLWLQLGDPDTARGAFREYDFQDRYPAYAHRFWNDAAGIYRRTGREDLARGAWRVANFWIPYRPYFVDRRYGWDDSELTGLRGGSQEYCAYDQFYIAGDRLAFASRYATVMGEVNGSGLKMDLAAIAIEHLEICKRTGYLPGHARLVEALVYRELGDMESARHELRAGKKWLRERGVVLPAQSAGTEVVVIRNTADRYDDDPERTLEILTDDWNTTHSAESRKALGLFLVRHGNPRQGKELLRRGEEDVDPLTLPAEDLCQLLEADRALGDQRLAGALVAALGDGRTDLPDDTQVWALAAFCFIDQGDRETGRLALARALELDPDNGGLRMQMRILDQ
jgi:tetratricopeptide (TPR) repeat protein